MPAVILWDRRHPEVILGKMTKLASLRCSELTPHMRSILRSNMTKFHIANWSNVWYCVKVCIPEYNIVTSWRHPDKIRISQNYRNSRPTYSESCHNMSPQPVFSGGAKTHPCGRTYGFCTFYEKTYAKCRQRQIRTYTRNAGKNSFTYFYVPEEVYQAR
jgi:hypothetical protein